MSNSHNPNGANSTLNAEKNKPQIPIQIRPCFPEEYPFIYNSWIKSGYRSKCLEVVAKELYAINQHDIISSLITRSNIIVAQELGKPENLFGYLVYDYVDGIFVAYYAYTKQLFRNIGILKNLLHHAGFDGSVAGFYTHHTKTCNSIDYKLNLLYNPYILINPKFAPWARQPSMSLVPPKVPSDVEILSKKDYEVDSDHLNILDKPNVRVEYVNNNIEALKPDVDEDDEFEKLFKV